MIETAQCGEALAACLMVQTENPSSVPGTHMVKREKQPHRLVSDLSRCAVMGVCKHLCTHKHTKVNT